MATGCGAHGRCKLDRAAVRILAGEAPRDVADDLALDGDELREALARNYVKKSKLVPIRQPHMARRLF